MLTAVILTGTTLIGISCYTLTVLTRHAYDFFHLFSYKWATIGLVLEICDTLNTMVYQVRRRHCKRRQNLLAQMVERPALLESYRRIHEISDVIFARFAVPCITVDLFRYYSVNNVISFMPIVLTGICIFGRALINHILENMEEDNVVLEFLSEQPLAEYYCMIALAILSIETHNWYGLTAAGSYTIAAIAFPTGGYVGENLPNRAVYNGIMCFFVGAMAYALRLPYNRKLIGDL